MALDPLALTYTQAEQLVRRPATDSLSALLYLSGDVWQNGEGWVGPRLLASSPGAAELLQEIRKSLAGVNLIRDLVGRHAAGVLGREPSWDLPGVAEADQEALTAWWDRVVMPTPPDERAPILGGQLGRALARALCGDAPVLRLRIIEGPPVRTLDEALARLTLEVLPGAGACVIPDVEIPEDDGLPPRIIPVGVALLDAHAHTLEALMGQGAPDPVAEVVTLDPAGRTVLALGGDISDPLPLGGRLTLYGLRCPPLVTEALIGIQKQLVKTLTVMGRNTDTAGFVERVFLNAQRPGTEVINADGTRTFEPAPYQAGPGTASWLVGVQDADGNVATPSALFRDPVSPATFLDTAAGLVFQAHKETRQLHALIAGDASPSGESRRQAAADFLGSLGPSARAVEAATRWLLETAYSLALALMGSKAPDGLRAVVTCQLSGTLPTVEELKETREAVGRKLLARATYQTAAGVADVQAEDEAIGEITTAPEPAPVEAVIEEEEA
jgi:hypothetical protein